MKDFDWNVFAMGFCLGGMAVTVIWAFFLP
jgi:hypothetical protein